MARILIGNIKGPQGMQGNDGGIGPVGPVGPPGPMGAVDNNTPIEFTEAVQNENIESGDAISEVFGKLKKWRSDLKDVAFSGSYDNLTDKPTIPEIPTADELNAIPVIYLNYEANNKQEILDKINNINLLFSDVKSRICCVILNDKVGDSPLGGGIHCVIGYVYPGGNYGCQIALSPFSSNRRLRVRDLSNNTWSDWASIYDTIYKPTPAEIGAAIPDKSYNISLTTGWSGVETPFTQSITVSGVTANSIVDIDVQSSVTAEQLDAYIDAKIVDGGQAANSITLKAFGKKPTIAIPIKVVVRG